MGCGSYSAAKATISARVMSLEPQSMTWSGLKSSQCKRGTAIPADDTSLFFWSETRSNGIAISLYVFVRSHDLVRKVCNFSGSCSMYLFGRVIWSEKSATFRAHALDSTPDEVDRCPGTAGGMRAAPGTHGLNRH
jgi:hypothetical protein